jgi:hypothetical protein
LCVASTQPLRGERTGRECSVSCRV